MARIIAVANQKGGTGKTTTTMNLGAALAEMGRKVLLVDLDQQGNLTMYAGIADPDEELAVEQTIYDVLASYADPKRKPKPVAPIIRQVNPRLSILQANGELGALDLELINALSRETVLKRALEPVRQSYDYILLDCPPDLSLIVVNALAAADEVLIALQAEYLATKGVLRLLRIAEYVKEHVNPNLAIAGIAITMADSRTLHSQQIIHATRMNFSETIQVFDTVIKSSVRLKEAPLSGTSILDYDPKGEAAASYRALAEEVDRHGK